MDEAAHFKITIDNDQLKRQAQESQRIIGGISKTAEQEGKKMDNVFSRIAMAAAGVFTIQQAASFARQVVSVRSEIEKLEISFETLLGNKEKADALFGSIRKFAVETPMQLKDLAQGAQTMLAFNISAEKVMPTLKAIGDISMGDSQKFGALTLAFSQMSSTGKLMGQDLLQMINAGFNPLAIIAEKTGKSIGDLKEEMSQGAISVEMVEDAFMAATSEGGKFYGMLEKQSKSVAGAISNLQGAFDDMLNALGEQAQGSLTELILDVTDLVKNYETLGRHIAEIIAIYGTYKAAVIAVTAVQGLQAMGIQALTTAEQIHYGWLVLVEKAQKMLNKTMLANPYVMIAAAVAALGAAIYELVKRSNEQSEAAKAVAQATEEFNTAVSREQLEIDRLFIKLRNAKKGTEEYERAKNAIQSNYGKYLNNLSEEVKSLQDVEAAYKAVSKAARDSAKARALEKASAEQADILAETEGQIRSEIYNMLKKKYAGRKTDQGRDLAEYYWGLAERYINGDTSVSRPYLTDFNNWTGGNDMIAQFNKLEQARRQYNAALNDVEIRFGGGITTEDVTESEQTVIQNKAYWENKKKEYQAQYDAMDEIARESEEGEKLREKIQEADKKIAGWDIKTTSKGNTTKTATTANYEKLQAYGDTVAKQVADAQFEIAQADIDAMKDGTEKRLKQIDLNYDRMIEENKRRAQEWVEALRENRMTEYEQNNPNASEADKIAFRQSLSSLGVQDLSEGQQAALLEYDRIAQQIRLNDEQETLRELLGEFETYLQKRNRIEEEYAAKRRAMYNPDGSLRDGFTQGNVEELDRQRDESLAAIDEEFASRQTTYKQWCDQITNLTLDQLVDMLSRVKMELEALEATADVDENKLAETRAKVKQLENAIKNVKDNLDIRKDNIEVLSSLADVAGKSAQAFYDLGDAVGGTVGKIFNTFGQLLSLTESVLGGIVSFAQTSVQSIEVTSEAAASAIKAAESASVILSIISAVIQAVKTLITMFDDWDERKEIAISNLRREIEDLQGELDYGIFNNSTLKIRELYDEIFDLLKKERELAGDDRWQDMNRYADIRKDAELLSRTIDALAQSYANLEYTADKALGAEKYQGYMDYLRNIAEQQANYYQMIREEAVKKEPDSDQIRDWERSINELSAQAQEYINEMVEEIVGGSAVDVANELGDAFIEAFAAGEDAAEAWGDKVNSIVADVMKRMLISKFLEERIGAVFDKYKAQWFDGSEFNIDDVINSMGSFAGDLEQIGTEFTDMWNALPDSVKQMFTDTADAREASQKGIATASQESIDELNGRMTAVQGHTYSIAENTRLLLSTTSSILNSVMNIESHAAQILSRLSTMEGDVNNMRSTLNGMNINGVKFK